MSDLTPESKRLLTTVYADSLPFPRRDEFRNQLAAIEAASRAAAEADADRLAAALRDWHDAALLRDWHDDDGMDGCSAVDALAAHDERRAL